MTEASPVSSRAGFTLVELLLVLVLVAVAGMLLQPRLEQGRAAARTDDTRLLADYLRAEADRLHGLWLINSAPRALSVKGRSVEFVDGYPDLASIAKFVPDDPHYQRRPIGWLRVDATVPARCSVAYRWPRQHGGHPLVVARTEGC